MSILLNLLFISLVWIAVSVLASIIILRAIAGGGKLPQSAASVTDKNTEKLAIENMLQTVNAAELHNLAVIAARAECGCRCHSEAMFPGMCCLDCMGELCDEGTQQ